MRWDGTDLVLEMFDCESLGSEISHLGNIHEIFSRTRGDACPNKKQRAESTHFNAVSQSHPSCLRNSSLSLPRRPSSSSPLAAFFLLPRWPASSCFILPQRDLVPHTVERRLKHDAHGHVDRSSTTARSSTMAGAPPPSAARKWKKSDSGQEACCACWTRIRRWATPVEAGSHWRARGAGRHGAG